MAATDEDDGDEDFWGDGGTASGGNDTSGKASQGMFGNWSPFLGALGPILGGVSALTGLFGAQRQAKEAEEARQAVIAKYQTGVNDTYDASRSADHASLMEQAGIGSDALAALGRGLGAHLAGAGLYNSTGVTGALAAGQRQQDASLSDLAARMQNSALQQRNAGLEAVANMNLGVANNDTSYARNNLSGAETGMNNTLAGLTNYLGTLGKPPVAAVPQTGAQYWASTGAPQIPGLPPLPAIPGAGAITPLAMPSASSLGTDAQNNLMLSGANLTRGIVPPVNGTYGQAAGLNKTNPYAVNSSYMFGR